MHTGIIVSVGLNGVKVYVAVPTKGVNVGLVGVRVRVAGVESVFCGAAVVRFNSVEAKVLVCVAGPGVAVSM